PGLPRKKRDRNKDGDERRGRRDYGEIHLIRSDDRRSHALESEPAVALDVLKHNDGIVNDEPRCKHERKEREKINGIPKHPDRRHGPDKRNRHCHRRDEGGSHLSKGEDDDDKNDDNGKKERIEYLLKRPSDE